MHENLQDQIAKLRAFIKSIEFESEGLFCISCGGWNPKLVNSEFTSATIGHSADCELQRILLGD